MADKSRSPSRASQPLQTNASPELIQKLGLTVSGAFLLAVFAPKPALSIGFTGDFGSTTWSINCGSVTDFGCGEVTGSNNARVNVSETPTSTFTSLWTNSAGRSATYSLSFDLSFADDSFNPSFGVSYGYYQIGSGGAQGQVGVGPPISFANIILSPDSTFSFGVFSDNAYMSYGNDAYLSISNFSATPVTPVTAPLVPAPLPAIGAASLFLGSRRLKKRMVQQRVLRLARRNLAPAIRSILPG